MLQRQSGQSADQKPLRQGRGSIDPDKAPRRAIRAASAKGVDSGLHVAGGRQRVRPSRGQDVSLGPAFDQLFP
ncbi:hypothetical protein D3C71_1787220 [compost metagenome]